MYFVDQPEGPKKPANATIEIDRSDLDEILGAPLPPSSPLPVSVPPPLPPEELARASFAPMQSFAPPEPATGGLLPYVIASVAVAILVAVAMSAVLYMHRRSAEVAAAPVASAPVASAAAPPSASAVSTATTLTIHTVELGGKPSE